MFLGFSIGRVRGNSMVPRILPNSFIIAMKWPRWLPHREGQMYYINHPRYGYIVKTLVAVDSDVLWFRGESEESVSCEMIGAVLPHQLLGCVIAVVQPQVRP